MVAGILTALQQNEMKISLPPIECHFKFWGGGGGLKPNFFNESIKR